MSQSGTFDGQRPEEEEKILDTPEKSRVDVQQIITKYEEIENLRKVAFPQTPLSLATPGTSTVRQSMDIVKEEDQQLPPSAYRGMEISPPQIRGPLGRDVRSRKLPMQ